MRTSAYAGCDDPLLETGGLDCQGDLIEDEEILVQDSIGLQFVTRNDSQGLARLEVLDFSSFKHIGETVESNVYRSGASAHIAGYEDALLPDISGNQDDPYELIFSFPGECVLPFDFPPCGCIDAGELVASVESWLAGSFGLGQLITNAESWKSCSS